MEALLLPNAPTYTELEQANTAEFVVSPCYHGYGTTLGNMLRRVVLSSLPGAAVTAVKIKGVTHEFSAIDGVLEDVVQVILNLKKLRVRVFNDKEVKLHLKADGAGVVTAAQIEATADVEVVNKDLVLATITDASKSFEMEIIVKQGRGYIPVEERQHEDLELGMIAVDSVYSPIVDFGYYVDFTRVGDITNYEKLTVRITTDGTITPRQALEQGVKILQDHLNIIHQSFTE